MGRTSLRASRTLVAIASSRNATSRNAVRQIADLSGAKASLSGCSTNTRQPSGLMVSKRAQHLRTRPDRGRPSLSRCGWRATSARLEPVGALRSWYAEDEIDFRVGNEVAARVDRVRIAGRSDAGTVDDLPLMERRSIIGDDDAPPGRLSATDHVGAASPLLEVDRPGTGASTARRRNSGAAERSRRCRPVGSSAEERCRTCSLPVECHVAQSADELSRSSRRWKSWFRSSRPAGPVRAVG